MRTAQPHACISLLRIVGQGDAVELADGVIALQHDTGVLPRNRRPRLHLRTHRAMRKPRAMFTDCTQHGLQTLHPDTLWFWPAAPPPYKLDTSLCICETTGISASESIDC